MNDRAVSVGRQAMPVLPALPAREPRLSPVLDGLVERMANPHPEAGVRGVVLPKFLRGEATAALDRYEQLAEPVSDDGLIMDWLTGVSLGMAQPLSGKELAVRATEIIPALSSLPASVFTSGTRQEAQIAFQWFPGVAELHALLSKHALGIYGKRRTLTALLETQEEAPVAPPSPEEVAAIREKLAAEFPEVPVVEQEGPRARYLTRDELRAAYARQAEHGDSAVAGIARHRLAMMNEARR
jgi:hypothetical protein